MTGATSGVGRATVRLFAREGASLGLIARGEAALAQTVNEVEELGGRALALPTDVADPEQVDSAARAVESEFGDIDLWVNNAMTTVFGYFSDIEPEEFRRANEVTYLGCVWGTRSALDRMSRRDEGTIIQVGSALAYRGIPAQSAYCGAKHAINGFTESVRSELISQDSNVHIGIVNLPALNTPQFSHCRSKFERHPMPVPPIFQPEVAAEAIRYAYRHRRREMHVGLPTVATVIGNQLAPGLLDRYLGETGVDSQLSNRPPHPNNVVGNLFEPVDGDPGAHGVFDAQSHGSSPGLWMSKNKWVLAGVAALGAGLFLTRD